MVRTSASWSSVLAVGLRGVPPALLGATTGGSALYRGGCDADRAVCYVPRRHAVPGRSAGYGNGAGAARAPGRVPGGADVLRADARQYRLPACGAAADPAVCGRFRTVR